MSLIGIASSILSNLSGAQNHRNPFQQVGSEFQQLGQDLQSGNLAQARSDFTTLSQNLSPVLQSDASAVASANPVVQAFAKLGQDLQSGNLQAAQQDFVTIQQDTRQNPAPVSGRHHYRHHTEGSANSTSSQQISSLVQDFSQLANSLQAGNLSAAQSAFSSLQNDLQQIGGFSASTSGGGATTASIPAGGLNVTACSAIITEIAGPPADECLALCVLSNLTPPKNQIGTAQTESLCYWRPRRVRYTGAHA